MGQTKNWYWHSTWEIWKWWTMLENKAAKNHTRWTYNGAKKNGGKSTANEAFPCFLWRQFDQRRFAEEESENVSHHIVDHYHRNGHDEPNQAFKHVLNDQVRLRDHNQQRDMCPGELWCESNHVSSPFVSHADGNLQVKIAACSTSWQDWGQTKQIQWRRGKTKWNGDMSTLLECNSRR